MKSKIIITSRSFRMLLFHYNFTINNILISMIISFARILINNVLINVLYNFIINWYSNDASHYCLLKFSNSLFALSVSTKKWNNVLIRVNQCTVLATDRRTTVGIYDKHHVSNWFQSDEEASALREKNFDRENQRISLRNRWWLGAYSLFSGLEKESFLQVSVTGDLTSVDVTSESKLRGCSYSY